MPVRIQKYIASAGVCSRRKAEELIRDGRVAVDGLTVMEMGVKIEPSENVVTVDGRAIEPAREKLYLALHKPVGCITSANGQFGRRTVLDLLTGLETRVFPVGRLDCNTSGLLLLTNDGDFAYRITHPKHNIEKTYIAEIAGRPSLETLETLRSGVSLEDGITFPARVWLVGGDKEDGGAVRVALAVTEGRNRLIRRMLGAVGHEVLSLHRVSVGGVSLGGLECGAYRRLSAGEIELFEAF